MKKLSPRPSEFCCHQRRFDVCPLQHDTDSVLVSILPGEVHRRLAIAVQCIIVSAMLQEQKKKRCGGGRGGAQEQMYVFQDQESCMFSSVPKRGPAFFSAHAPKPNPSKHTTYRQEVNYNEHLAM